MGSFITTVLWRNMIPVSTKRYIFLFLPFVWFRDAYVGLFPQGRSIQSHLIARCSTRLRLSKITRGPLSCRPPNSKRYLIVVIAIAPWVVLEESITDLLAAVELEPGTAPLSPSPFAPQSPRSAVVAGLYRTVCLCRLCLSVPLCCVCVWFLIHAFAGQEC